MNAYEVLARDHGVLLRMFQLINKRFDNDKTGGFIAINPDQGNDLFNELAVLPIGNVPNDKMQKYCIFAQEKIARLVKFPKTNASYETRDEEKNHWGGSVRLPNGTCIGFSGLPELGDECLVLMYAYYKKQITEPQALELSNAQKMLSDLFDAFDFSD
ncbi:hypothetical protein ISR92_02115 [Patescibacteria group bacterium]|nr:hypothetical protein [Patescibacteria group bacterium]